MLLETEEQIRARISRRFRRWLLFITQFVLTLPVGLLTHGFSIFLGWRLEPIILSLWFASLFLHGIYLVADTAKEWAIRHEIERQQRLIVASGYSLKQKRSSRLSLAEDGELQDISEFISDQRDVSAY
jgi:hypothetical protein